jgi:peptidoglycan hydrolase CwlO-like protein
MSKIEFTAALEKHDTKDKEAAADMKKLQEDYEETPFVGRELATEMNKLGEEIYGMEEEIAASFRREIELEDTIMGLAFKHAEAATKIEALEDYYATSFERKAELEDIMKEYAIEEQISITETKKLQE